MNKLPNGWTQSTFGECLQYEQPTKYIVKSTKYNDSYKTPVLTAGKSFILGYTNETDGIFTQTPVIIFDDFTTDTKFVDFHFKVKSSAMKILRSNGKADIKFLYYLMQIIYHRSDTHKRYWIAEYSKIKIPLPPLAIQKQIAERLDYLFDKIDKALTFLKENKEYIKKYRLSILKYAFEGKLTPSSKNWEIKTLNDIASFYSGYTPKKDKLNKNNIGFPYFKISDMNFEYNKKFLKISKEFTTSNKFFNKNSIAFPKNGGAIFTNKKRILLQNSVVDLNTAVLTPILHKINLDFLFFFFYSIDLGKYVRGSILPTIDMSKIKQIKIPLPPLETQKEIVLILEKKFKSMDEIERLNNDNIENLLLLKKSLLKEAFSGKL